jgi:hypothetical protein
VVTDAAVNSSAWYTLLSTDAKSRTRTAVYDVGAEENETFITPITYPLDSTMVGAGKPATVVFPVRLLDFDAVASGDMIRISWQVAEESGVARYEVEHSKGGSAFVKIGSVAANNQTGYAFSFNSGGPGKQYFRLKILDRDGSVAYSPIKLITISKASSIVIYPNPATGYLVVNTTSAGSLHFIIMDASGRQVHEQEFYGTHRLNTAILTPGVYYLRLRETGETKTFIVH